MLRGSPFLYALLQVQGVVLDPSCSGSGTVVSRMDHLLPKAAPAVAATAAAEGAAGGAAAGRGAGAAAAAGASAEAAATGAGSCSKEVAAEVAAGGGTGKKKKKARRKGAAELAVVQAGDGQSRGQDDDGLPAFSKEQEARAKSGAEDGVVGTAMLESAAPTAGAAAGRGMDEETWQRVEKLAKFQVGLQGFQGIVHSIYRSQRGFFT